MGTFDYSLARSSAPHSSMQTRPKPLGELLVDSGSLRARDLEAALAEQDGSTARLGDILVTRGYVDEVAVARTLANQFRLPFVEGPLNPDQDAIRLIDGPFARARNVLPLSADNRTLRLAVADPLDQVALDEARFSSGRHVEAVVAAPSALTEAIRAAYEEELADLVDGLPDVQMDAENHASLHAIADAAPVVRLVNHVLHRAVALGASDIHLEPSQGQLLVRWRVDGVLRSALTLPGSSLGPVASRIKVISGLDISVKRRPQDGGLAFQHGSGSLRVRVSTLPTVAGEKIVLRLLDPLQAPRNLDALGIAHRDLQLIRRLGAAGQGVILAAGPTGSGKSSSLFAALAELNQEGLNVVTVEDPVEYRVPGINQVQVQPLAGMTFPAALRAILRQDPDVVMIGEIRDRETAEIAMAAAVTGHLVLSTIHTTDAPGAITRLLHMGVPAYLVAGGLTGVIAQRLVRTLCTVCRGRSVEGCGKCPDGYSGRTGVFQVLAINDYMRDEIIRGASTATLRCLAAESGMASLSEDARRKVAEGLTTPHEVARVIQTDAGAVVPCSSCGGEVPTEALGCPYCGRGIRSLCRCGVQLRRGWRFCPGCLRALSAPQLARNLS